MAKKRVSFTFPGDIDTVSVLVAKNHLIRFHFISLNLDAPKA